MNGQSSGKIRNGIDAVFINIYNIYIYVYISEFKLSYLKAFK